MYVKYDKQVNVLILARSVLYGEPPLVLFCFIRVVGWLVGFLTSSSTTRLYRGRAARQSVWQFYVLPHSKQRGETMTSVSAGHIILTPTQPVRSRWPQRESNSGPPHQESRALPTELPRPSCCVILKYAPRILVYCSVYQVLNRQRMHKKSKVCRHAPLNLHLIAKPG